MSAGFPGSQAHIASLCEKTSGDALAGATIFADGVHERTKGHLTFVAYVYCSTTRQLYTLAVMDWPKKFAEDQFILADFWRLFSKHVKWHVFLTQNKFKDASTTFDAIPDIRLENFSMDEAA
jgi:hypothetical protein